MTQKNNEYKGYSLFSDIEDADLRNRNRAVILANIAEDNTDHKTKNINVKGASLILGYFLKVPEAERDNVKSRWVQNMTQRGFKLEQPTASF